MFHNAHSIYCLHKLIHIVLIYFRVRMKINLSYPATGCQKLIEIADELKVRI